MKTSGDAFRLVGGTAVLFLVVGLVVGAFVFSPLVAAQDASDEKPLPAAAGPPSDLAKLQQKAEEARGKKVTPPALDQLLEQIAKRPGGKEKADMARANKPGKAAPAAAGPPSDLAEGLKRAEEARAKGPGRPPSVDQLLEQISKRPGGKARVDAAKAARGKGKGKGGGAMAWFSRLNPFQPATALAAGYSATLNPANNWRDGSAWVSFYGSVGYFNSIYNWSDSTFGTTNSHPFAYTGATVPATGWYVTTVNASSDEVAFSVFHYGGSSGWTKVATLPVGLGTSYPMLLYLSEGDHHFNFVVDSGYCYVYSITWQQVSLSYE